MTIYADSFGWIGSNIFTKIYIKTTFSDIIHAQQIFHFVWIGLQTSVHIGVTIVKRMTVTSHRKSAMLR